MEKLTELVKSSQGSKSTTSTSASKSTSSVPKFVGCYLDKSDRDMPIIDNAGRSNPEKCFEIASQKGFKYVGLQNGNECNKEESK